MTRQLSLEKEEELHLKLEHQLDEVVSSKKRHVYYMTLRLASYPGLLIPAFVACSVNTKSEGLLVNLSWAVMSWTLDGCLQE